MAEQRFAHEGKGCNSECNVTDPEVAYFTLPCHFCCFVLHMTLSVTDLGKRVQMQSAVFTGKVKLDYPD